MYKWNFLPYDFYLIAFRYPVSIKDTERMRHVDEIDFIKHLQKEL